jgi:mxaA protein
MHRLGLLALMTFVLVLAALAFTDPARADAQPLPDPSLLYSETTEPRAFGYQVGDLVQRLVSVHVPDGLKLDEASVPQPGGRGTALELRSVAKHTSRETGGLRLELHLEYQVFLSPPQTRTIEMPVLVLHFTGTPRPQDLHVDAWPVTIASLAPPDVSPRRGLGDLQPDAAPTLLDTKPGVTRLIAYAVVAIAILLYLAHVYIGLPWWARTHRPFTLAWRNLRHMPADGPQDQWREAFAKLHAALNHTAGEAVFEHSIDRFLTTQPRYGHLRDDLVTFFQQSRREFFAHGTQASAQRLWLLDFCRRCRDAERGSA